MDEKKEGSKSAGMEVKKHVKKDVEKGGKVVEKKEEVGKEEKKEWSKPRSLTKGKGSQASIEARGIIREVCQRTGMAESNVLRLVVLIQKSFRRRILACRLKRLISAYSITNAGLETKKRGRVLMEIVDTERSYVDNMRVCVNSFLKPLLNPENTKILTEAEVESVFGNFYEVYRNNKTLLRKLQAAMKVWPEQNDLTTIFLNLNYMLGVYEEYITQYQTHHAALKELMKTNKEFQLFLKKTNKGLDGKSLSSYYLIMPVQRLPRYQLLLNELYKCTPESHVDRADIGQSVERMIQVNRHINDKQRVIADSEEELSKLEGLDELLDEPKAWHSTNNYIKQDGTITVEIESKDRHNYFGILLPRSLLLTKKTLTKRVEEKKKNQTSPLKESQAVKPKKSTTAAWKVIRVVNWEKVVDVYEDSFDTFHVVILHANLYSAIRITATDEEWKSSFLSLLSSRPDDSAAPLDSSIHVSFRFLGIFLLSNGKLEPGEGNYKVAAGLEGKDKDKCEIGEGFYGESNISISATVSGLGAVAITVTHSKSKVKIGEMRVPVLHCRMMVDKGKGNDHALFLKKEKVGVLRFSVVSKVVSAIKPRHKTPPHGSPQIMPSPGKIRKASTFSKKEKEREWGENNNVSSLHSSFSHGRNFNGQPGSGRSLSPPPIDSRAHQARRVNVKEKASRKVSKPIFPASKSHPERKRRGSDPWTKDDFEGAEGNSTPSLSLGFSKESFSEALSWWPTSQIIEYLTSCYLSVDEVFEAREVVNKHFQKKLGKDREEDKEEDSEKEKEKEKENEGKKNDLSPPWELRRSPVQIQSDAKMSILNCLTLNRDQEEVLALREEVKLLKEKLGKQ